MKGNMPVDYRCEYCSTFFRKMSVQPLCQRCQGTVVTPIPYWELGGEIPQYKDSGPANWTESTGPR